MSTGMPRPLSSTVTLLSTWIVTSMRLQCPPRASSIELSTTSKTKWWRPRSPVSPMYIPGLFWTASSPSRTLMLSALYVEVSGKTFSAMSISIGYRGAMGPTHGLHTTPPLPPLSNLSTEGRRVKVSAFYFGGLEPHRHDDVRVAFVLLHAQDSGAYFVGEPDFPGSRHTGQ